MFFNKYSSEAYWNSYRLLESQLIRLSHSICFDDSQIDVYSSELADLINSACVKIESLAKDIYEQHICPFQLDKGIVPRTFTDGIPKRQPIKFKPENWTREKWKYDYNCLVEIDERFSLSKKRVKLKLEHFNFQEYGSTLLPFKNISLNDCRGGKWEYMKHDIWKISSHRLIDVDWCKSYQSIKHNYVQSIQEHGTIKNAIMVMAAFYLLAVYNSCLPSKRFEWGDKADYDLDFGSELFACEMCNHMLPPFVIDSDQIQIMKSMREAEEKAPHKQIYADQNLLNDIEGFPFLVILNDETCYKVRRSVDEYCAPRKLEVFDIAPYEQNKSEMMTSEGAKLYLNLKQYIRPPYRRSNICIAFNLGNDKVYSDYWDDYFEYEKSKHRIHTEKVLATLRVGDYVDAKFLLSDVVLNAEVKKINEHGIDLCIREDGKEKMLLEAVSNIIYMKNRSSKD